MNCSTTAAQHTETSTGTARGQVLERWRGRRRLGKRWEGGNAKGLQPGLKVTTTCSRTVREHGVKTEEKTQRHKVSSCRRCVPLTRLLIPRRLTKTLSMSSLPVNSSAITYRLGLTDRAASNMAWTRREEGSAVNTDDLLTLLLEIILFHSTNFYNVKNTINKQYMDCSCLKSPSLNMSITLVEFSVGQSVGVFISTGSHIARCCSKGWFLGIRLFGRWICCYTDQIRYGVLPDQSFLSYRDTIWCRKTTDVVTYFHWYGICAWCHVMPHNKCSHSAPVLLTLLVCVDSGQYFMMLLFLTGSTLHASLGFEPCLLSSGFLLQSKDMQVRWTGVSIGACRCVNVSGCDL